MTDDELPPRTLKVWLAKLEKDLNDEGEKAEENACCVFWEMVHCIVGDYARHILTPRILADQRRRAGDSSASPRDYDCRRTGKGADGLPNCAGRRRGCKFAPVKQNDEWFKIHQRERTRIVDGLTDDPDRCVAELFRMEKELIREDWRRRRSTGNGIERAVTGCYA